MGKWHGRFTHHQLLLKGHKYPRAAGQSVARKPVKINSTMPFDENRLRAQGAPSIESRCRQPIWKQILFREVNKREIQNWGEILIQFKQKDEPPMTNQSQKISNKEKYSKNG